MIHYRDIEQEYRKLDEIMNSNTIEKKKNPVDHTDRMDFLQDFFRFIHEKLLKIKIQNQARTFFFNQLHNLCLTFIKVKSKENTMIVPLEKTSELKINSVTYLSCLSKMLQVKHSFYLYLGSTSNDKFDTEMGR